MLTHPSTVGRLQTTPHHALGDRPPRGAAYSIRGFTLIELLVVIVIVAIIASVTVISMGVLGRDSQIRDEAQRIDALMTLLHQQAEMQGRDYGLLLKEHGYEFLSFDVRRQLWSPVLGDDFFRERQLPAGLGFRLYLEGREVSLKPPKLGAGSKSDSDAVAKSAGDADSDSESGLKEAEDQPAPQIFIASSGDLTAFELKLEREGTDHEYTILGKADGKIRVKESGPNAPKDIDDEEEEDKNKTKDKDKKEGLGA